MSIAIILVLCSFVAGIAPNVLDRPFLGVQLYGEAELECCYPATLKPREFSWYKRIMLENKTTSDSRVMHSTNVTARPNQNSAECRILTFKTVQLNDTGMYYCLVKSNDGFHITDGTYMQVYKHLEKTINLSESTKNKILTAEGILLLLIVILPSVTLLFKSKKLHQLEKKKMKKEEENIYQGLNLDDCRTTYDQIERSQGQGPYQDVCNIMEEEEIQLEKP